MNDGRRLRDAKRSAEYVTICGDVAYVELTQEAVAIIDAADAVLVGERLWHLGGDGYAARNIKTDGKWTQISLHRFLLDPPPDMQVDHINGDRLDNRRANLRICSPSENQCNKPPYAVYGGAPVTCDYKGVSASGGKYRATIWTNGKKHHLGYFQNETEAARAYDAAASELHGIFARINFAGGAA